MDARKLVDKNTITLANVAEIPSEKIERLLSAKTLYFDTETTALHPWNGGEIALLQIYDPESCEAVLGKVNAYQEPPEWVKDLFTPDKTLVGHNIGNFDIHFLHAWGLPWQKAKYFDTLIAESLITTSGRRDVSKSLRATVKRRTGYDVDKTMEHTSWRNAEFTDRQIEYAAIDVLALPEMYAEQLDKAESTGQSGALAMEMEVMPVFSRMTINGLPVDRNNLAQYMEQQRIRIAEAEVLLNQRLGKINYGSHVQLKKAFKTIGIELESTAKNVLIDQILFDPESDNAKLLQALLDWRAPHKRTEMYGSEEWQATYIQPDGRVHARFWQVGADTTRVSSSDPNLQQVPKDGRWIFGGVPGHKIVSVDYSQIEVRIAADISEDLDLIAMLGAEDVHSGIASKVFHKPVDQVTKAERKISKALVFTLLFGGGYGVLYNYARRSGSSMTEEEALELFNAFFDAFQGLKSIRQKAYGLAKHRNHVVITLPNGSRRVLAGAKLSPTTILNTPVQGTAAVGMKQGLILAGKKGLDDYLGAVVHDEGVSCVPDEIAEDFAREFQKCLVDGMAPIVPLCPIKAEIGRDKDGNLPTVWLP